MSGERQCLTFTYSLCLSAPMQLKLVTGKYRITFNNFPLAAERVFHVTQTSRLFMKNLDGGDKCCVCMLLLMSICSGSYWRIETLTRTLFYYLKQWSLTPGSGQQGEWYIHNVGLGDHVFGDLDEFVRSRHRVLGERKDWYVLLFFKKITGRSCSWKAAWSWWNDVENWRSWWWIPGLLFPRVSVFCAKRRNC